MATRATEPPELQARRQGTLLEQGITPPEGIEAFSRALGSGLPQVLVSTHDLARRLEMHRIAPGLSAIDVWDRDGRPPNARPALTTPYQAPHSAVEQTLEDPLTTGLLQIERQTLLVAIDAQEVRTFFTDERRAPRAGVVTTARLLDFDDASAHVGEEHRAIRSRQDAGQVDNEQILKWRRGVGHQREGRQLVAGTLNLECPVWVSPP